MLFELDHHLAGFYRKARRIGLKRVLYALAHLHPLAWVSWLHPCQWVRYPLLRNRPFLSHTWGRATEHVTSCITFDPCDLKSFHIS